MSKRRFWTSWCSASGLPPWTRVRARSSAASYAARATPVKIAAIRQETDATARSSMNAYSVGSVSSWESWMRTSSNESSLWLRAALAHHVGGCAARHAAEVERHEGDPAALHSARRIDAEEDERVGRDGTVCDPRSLLAGEHPVVPVTARDHVCGDARIDELRRPDHERIGAVRRLGDRPATDVTCLSVLGERPHEVIDQTRVPRARDHDERERRHPDHNRQVGAAPAELLEEDVLGEAARAQTALLDRDGDAVVEPTLGGGRARAGSALRRRPPDPPCGRAPRRSVGERPPRTGAPRPSTPFLPCRRADRVRGTCGSATAFLAPARDLPREP
jgi:hypothetical protein